MIVDEFSDLYSILVISKMIAPHKKIMIEFADKFGNLLNAFTGKHVVEQILLICLFDDPLLNVDIKFITSGDFFETEKSE